MIPQRPVIDFSRVTEEPGRVHAMLEHVVADCGGHGDLAAWPVNCRLLERNVKQPRH
jgi:hypothetical protein